MDDEHARKSGFASGEIEIVTTSGTSEDRVSVVWHQAWWDRSEREAARINPVLARIFSHTHREAVLTSPLCAGNICHVGDAPMKDRIVDSLLFLNQSPDPTSWDAQNVRRMAEELRLFQPEILESDPAYLAILSRACADAGIELYRPACIVLTYEFPSRMHLRAIRSGFPGVPVVSSYGSTETGHVFTQCEAGAFHQNTATCHVDIQPFRQEIGDPHVGRILVSTLDNPWFTLLRFDVGDLARIAPAPCPCGRTDGLTVASIEGRSRDVTFTTEGRTVTAKALDDALAEATELTGYLVEQVGHGRYVARYQSERGAEERTREAVQESLRSVYGRGAAVETRLDAALAPEQSGKFRLAHAAPLPSVEALYA
jgi:phenylacetate-CoA ligase